MSTSPSVNNVNDGLATAAAPVKSDSVGCRRKSRKRALSLTNISVPDPSSKKPRGRKPKVQKENNIDNDGAVRTTASLLQQSNNNSTQTSDVTSDYLLDEIRSLREVVTALSAKVNELMSLLLPVNIPAQQSNVIEPQPISYAAVVTDSRTNAKPRDHTTSQDAVTAMYVDLRRKQQRSNNIVITGLQNSDNDAALVTELLQEEFGCDEEMWPGVSVARCQRLGRRQDDKLQPLLVTLDSHDQAEYYIKNARFLRSSNNQEIKRNVYINADLTPSEAKAAYELRMERKRKHSVQGDRAIAGDNQTRVYFRSKSARTIIDKQVNVLEQSTIDSSHISLKWRTTAPSEKLTQSSSALSISDASFVLAASNNTTNSSSLRNVCSNSQVPAAELQAPSTATKLSVKSVESVASPMTSSSSSSLSSLSTSPTATLQSQPGRPGCSN